MIVYTATKAEFNNDVIMNQISDKILQKLHEANIHGGEDAEYRSWQNSLVFMRNVLDDKDIPDDANIPSYIRVGNSVVTSINHETNVVASVRRTNKKGAKTYNLRKKEEW